MNQFWGISKKMHIIFHMQHIPLHDKFLFHMRFWAFHVTSRIRSLGRKLTPICDVQKLRWDSNVFADFFVHNSRIGVKRSLDNFMSYKKTQNIRLK